ncbi:capsid maturation protease [Gordonia phage Pytheas]|nr:capsid maturation protease [Gordonia Phage Jablanski]UYL88032.1 capsid maturation protease [Gordonia phage Pytheas]
MTVSPSERKLLLGELSSLAADDLTKLWAAASDLSSAEFVRFIVDGFPHIADPWAALAGDMSAQWYDDAAPDSAFRATAAGMPTEEALQTSATWALNTTTGEAALSLLTGTLQRAVFDGSRQTILHNVAREPRSRWARHASANACEFCRLMATRGGVYGSRATAMSSHDSCHCVAIEIRPGGKYEPAPYVERFEAEYQAARRRAGSGDPKAILAAWRQLQTS